MINGIVLIKKPAGVSSARVVARVKKKMGVKKAGHTGTLDPFATGLLLCAVNKATRISQFFLNGNKHYTARIHLGRETDTGDGTGEIVHTVPDRFLRSLTRADVEKTIESFTGVQLQVPPVYSALKHQGVPLYKLARQGRSVEKPPREIEIFKLDIRRMDLPVIDVDIACSGGTYIRSLAHDIGKKLGCGAFLSALHRTGSSHFTVDEAMDLEKFETLAEEVLLQRVIPMSQCLPFMPKMTAAPQMVTKIFNGQKISVRTLAPPREGSGDPIRVVDSSGTLVAIVCLDESRQTYNYTCVFPPELV